MPECQLFPYAIVVQYKSDCGYTRSRHTTCGEELETSFDPGSAKGSRQTGGKHLDGDVPVLVGGDGGHREAQPRARGGAATSSIQTMPMDTTLREEYLRSPQAYHPEEEDDKKGLSAIGTRSCFSEDGQEHQFSLRTVLR